ncbi:AbgT family transporter [Aerococcaceae bacterium DSM 111020]|nr:AbgT family transporter [Aerococcaceae bacterium DSM 111020]
MANNENNTDQNHGGILNGIERIGNKLPHPVVLFIILALIVIVISELAARFDLSATYFDSAKGQDVTVYANTLMNKEGIRYIFNNAVLNFTGFAPLGTVLVTMLGVGAAEWTGLINTGLKRLIQSVPDSLLTLVIVFAGVMSSIASDAGYVVVIPLGGILFASAGRHPVAGIAAAFAGVSCGFSANLLIGPNDALLTGLTNEALRSAGIDYQMSITGNWYFMIASTFLLTLIGTIVTIKVTEPRLGEYTGDYQPENTPLTKQESNGLRNAFISLIIFIAIFAFMLVPENGALRSMDPETGLMTTNEFMNNGLIFALFLLFLIPGVAYGLTTGKIKNTEDFVEGMVESMRTMANYIVLAFFASQFISYFAYTNLGTILSVNGAQFLESVSFTGFPLILAFIALAMVLDLFLGSASAKWAIMAPIFVPMLFQLGLTPELTQASYRIADSVVNVITPLMSYFAMVLVFMKQYDKKSGLGTLISTMLPYSISFALGWVLLLAIWYFFNIPLGPGAPIMF